MLTVLNTVLQACLKALTLFLEISTRKKRKTKIKLLCYIVGGCQLAIRGHLDPTNSFCSAQSTQDTSPPAALTPQTRLLPGTDALSRTKAAGAKETARRADTAVLMRSCWGRHCYT